MTQKIKQAKEFFYNKEYAKARKLFLEENDFYSTGLCCLLLGKEKASYLYWKKNCFENPASAWGLRVLELIHLKAPKIRPSFFQTRAFLEIYLNLFLQNEKFEWAQNLISSCDYLYQSNPESYKFIARALYSNGYFDLAIQFCKKTLKLFYSDPEAFLILSQCYYLIDDLGEALDCINRVLDIVDDYYPAIVFHKILKEKIEKRRKGLA